MRACIITIGDELLQGFTIDTNSAWIARAILPHGVFVEKKFTISDDQAEIISAVQDALDSNFDFIFVTGGLGPTHDDITKKAFQVLFKSEEIFDADYFEQLRERFARRGFKISDNNRSQATILTGCDPLPNPVGTALGMRFEEGSSQIFILPGVPAEMKAIITETIIPRYLPRDKSEYYTTLRTAGIPESRLAERIKPILDSFSMGFKFAFLPHHTGVNLRIRKKGGTEPELTDLLDQLHAELGFRIYGQDGESMSSAVAELLKKQGKTIAAAESCTGGLIAKLLTDIPGSSDYFLGGFVTYSNQLKEDILKIPKEMMIDFGAVSEETASAMATGCRDITGADISISTTGISGPGGATASKPLGLVYIGIAWQGGTQVRNFTFLYDREMHREATAQTALNLVRKFLIHGPDK